MGGIIADNVGRSSGLIKSAAAPAGIVLVDTAYCSASSIGGYTTWTGRGTGSMGGSYGEWGGVLPSSTLAITWGSTIAFPATGVYQIHVHTVSGNAYLVCSVDDGSYGAGNSFMAGYGYTVSSGFPHMGWVFSYTVDDISNDKLRFYTNQAFRTGAHETTSLMISKFE